MKHLLLTILLIGLCGTAVAGNTVNELGCINTNGAVNNCKKIEIQKGGTGAKTTTDIISLAFAKSKYSRVECVRQQYAIVCSYEKSDGSSWSDKP